jgi:hypothetical protein
LQASSKLVSGLCHQRVLIAASLDYTRFKSAWAMTDLATGDLPK